MSLRVHWEKGKHNHGESTDRRHGEVYLALDKTTGDYTAVKRVHMKVDESTVKNESKKLRECGSKYIVRYFNLVKMGSEVWVRLLAVRYSCVDCDGVLPLWINRPLFE